MDKCFVYVLCDCTGIRYIGVSINPNQRFKNHIYEARNKNNKSYNLRKSRWIRSIDFNFQHRIVFSGTEEECYNKEVELIKLALSKGKSLVNLTTGGDRPPRITTLPNYNEIREKIKKKAVGRIISSDTKRKMSESRIGIKPHWVGDLSGYKNPRARSIVQKDLNDNVIFIWATAKEACDALGLSKASVTSACSGRQKTAGGYKFLYF